MKARVLLALFAASAAFLSGVIASPASAAARRKPAATTTTSSTVAPSTTTSTTAAPTTTTTVAPTTTTTAPPATTTTTAPPPAATRTPLASCSDGSPVLNQTVTAEHVLIAICTNVGNWTTSAINDLLHANALDLAVVGPTLTVQVATGVPSSTGTSAACCDANGRRYNYRAYMSLNPSATSTFASAPDAIFAHEYGHAWTQYWRYMNPAHSGSWSAYTNFRWATGDGSQVLAQHTKLNTAYNWMDYELAADDYRRLFGSPAAQSQLAFMNGSVPDSNVVVGLAPFFLDTWR